MQANSDSPDASLYSMQSNSDSPDASLWSDTTQLLHNYEVIGEDKATRCSLPRFLIGRMQLGCNLSGLWDLDAQDQGSMLKKNY